MNLQNKKKISATNNILSFLSSSTSKLSAYTGEDVTITLPDGKHWGADGVRSFSIWCKASTENFGDVLTNGDYLLPPYIADESMVSDDLHHG